MRGNIPINLIMVTITALGRLLINKQYSPLTIYHMKKDSKEATVKMIDFSKATIERIDGTAEVIDCSGIAKNIAEIMFNNTSKLGVKIACQTLFKEGKIEYEEEMANELRSTIESLMVNDQPIAVILREALLSCIPA